MSNILQELVVSLVFDGSKFDDGINGAIGKSNNLASGLSKIGGGVVAGALGLATAGITGLGFALTDATKGAMDAQNIQADLNATLQSTGGISGMTADSVNELAGALSEVTRFEDDVIVAGDNMLLTFTNIGKDVFPQATEAMLNMATKMGGQPVDMAIMLGKALNDPTNGLSALTRNGVVFTEQQKEQIKAMQEAGDMAGAQKIILAELEKEFGGLAVAAGQTAAGQMDIFMNKIGNIKDLVGAQIIPVLTQLTTVASEMLSRPEVQAGISAFIDGIGKVAQTVIENIPVAIETLQNIVSWFQNNEGIIVGILAALGVAVGDWAVTTVIAIGSVLVELAPIIAVMALVGLAAYALYEAWTNNFGGIQDKVKAVWEYLQPIFENIKDWLATNIPIAIEKLKSFWEKSLLPAIKNVWGWIDAHLIPLFKVLGELVGTYAVWAFGNLMKIIDALWPPIQNYLVWAFGNLMKIIEIVAPYVSDYLSWSFSNLTKIIDGVTWAIQGVVDWLNKLNGMSVDVNANMDISGNNIPNTGRAGGGQIKPGQSVWVGESGKEIFTAGKGGGYVTPNNSLAESESVITLLKEIANTKLNEGRLAKLFAVEMAKAMN